MKTLEAAKTHPVHKDFVTIANKELDRAPKTTTQLRSLGFKEPEIDFSDRELDIIDGYFRLGYFFVSHRQLERLCFKHGLFYSEPENFIGIVPEENQEDLKVFIENAPIAGVKFVNRKVGEEEDIWITARGHVIPVSDLEDSHINNILNKLGGKRLRGEVKRNYESVHAEAARRGLIGGSIFLDETEPVETPSIIVAATRDFFADDVAVEHPRSRYLSKEGFAEEIRRQLPKDDPIILATVPEGYLVITMWDEADISWDNLHD